MRLQLSLLSAVFYGLFATLPSVYCPASPDAPKSDLSTAKIIKFLVVFI
jgi:hypothetical protein